MAATLLIAAVTGWFAFDGSLDAARQRVPLSVVQPRIEIHETAVGGLRAVSLSDGSTMTLNTATRVRVELSGRRRTVELQRGEALFDVAADADRPFVVRTATHDFQAIGTAFNVESIGSGLVELIVTEGTVRVTQNAEDGTAAADGRGAGASTSVVAGRLARFWADGRQIVDPLQPGEGDAKLAWRGGTLVFRDERLTTVLAEVARYTQTRLVLNDPELGEERVVGVFRTGDVDGLLTALSRDFGIAASAGDGEFRLTARPGSAPGADTRQRSR